MHRTHVLVGLCFLASSLATAAVVGQETNPVRTRPATAADSAPRVLVKFRAPGATGRVQALATEGEDRVAALGARSGVGIRSARRIGSRLHVLELDGSAAPAEQLERLRADSSVEQVRVDRRRYAHALPNDPLYTGQWYLKTNGTTAASAIDAERAWDVTVGSTGVVIAVLDTGVRYDHPDLVRAELGGRLLPGYDFVSDTVTANDGNGRDADASDPGDYVTQGDVATPQFSNCDVATSSWHGTRVAGVIGARADNGEGIAGTSWTPWILPVRALGKCGGFDSDILPAMLWAGGVHVDGVPDNPYPAKILNLSLGSEGACDFFYQDVIDELAARNVLVVVSAGNEGGPVDAPANCGGVVGVGGLRHAGTKVGYSSLGPEVAVSAPAGNCVNLSGACLFPIDTTVNFGTVGPGTNGYSDQVNANIGTSFSAPIVAGIAGLMLSVNGNLDPAAVRLRLQEGATKPFPVSPDTVNVAACRVPTGPTDVQGSECNCTTETCGAGMANALGSVQAALRPIVAVATPALVSPGQPVALSAASSAAACGRSVASYAWSVVDGTGTITGSATAAATTVDAPPSGQQFTVRVTVTDDAGRSDSADVLVGSSVVASAAPQSAGTAACLAAIPPPALTPKVAITPSTLTLIVGQSQTFGATVENANATNNSVTWYVDGVAGGNATLGTISSAGVYVAPSTIAASTVVIVSAEWVDDPSVAGSAQVTIMPIVVTGPSPSSDGGGGVFGWLDLAALAGLLGFGTRRRSIAR
jgi:serine protease